MMRNRAMFLGITLLTISFAASNPVFAHKIGSHGDDDRWNFLFGNNFDTHQKSWVSKGVRLSGLLYIRFTGETRGGIPIAKHCDKDTPARECVPGWKMRGRSLEATFLYHHHDHPVWLVEDRGDIPQPGAFSHFHWVTAFGTDRRAKESDFDEACNAEKASQLITNTTCPGYLLELVALRSFIFSHANENVLVRPGIDIATHLNLVTSAPGNGGHSH